MGEPERESLAVDVLIVGGGPAGLATALHLANLIEKRNAEAKGEPLALEIGLIEKGAEIGMHGLSGGVMDPRAIRELLPDLKEIPGGAEVKEDDLLYLTESRKIKFPFVPPKLKNKGKFIISLAQLCRTLGEMCEKKGVNLFAGFAGAEVLYDDADPRRVVGVRTQDRGIGKNGERKASFEPGVDIKAKVTVLAEGPRGTLMKKLTKKLDLDAGKQPQLYATGVKEIWRVAAEKHKEGSVAHTMGWPLPADTVGGGWVYHMKDRLVSIGFVTSLDYTDPTQDPHRNLQVYKTHPFIRELLDGAEIVDYGAKAVPEGGYFSIPRIAGDGFLVVGDSAGFLDAQRLKGIHLAIKSGMLAAEAIVEAAANGDFSAAALGAYEAKVYDSYVGRELWAVRNFHQSLARWGMHAGLLVTGAQMLFGGRFLKAKVLEKADWQHFETLDHRLGGAYPERDALTPKYDGVLTFDKVTDVYHSGTEHEEDQPSHLVIADTDICHTRCAEEYGNPCQYFCPANVYEMVVEGDGARKLRLNPSNCVHCKTCDIKDPYQIIDWVVPEGGGGPKYKLT